MNEARSTISRFTGKRHVDFIVVGAGPAGSVSARGLAASGARVLLVDGARFPRWKVCGCCLNGAALQTLSEVGLLERAKRLGAERLSCFRVAARGNIAELALPSGVALSRERFDEALIREAVNSGAEFSQQTRATWLAETKDGVDIALRSRDSVERVQARIVIAADGLRAGFTRRIPGVRAIPARNSRIGAGAALVDPNADYGPHVIHMAVGTGGYVGLVRLEDGRLNIAAAFDGSYVRRMGGLHSAATHVLSESGFPVPNAVHDVKWQGTPPLTRRYQPPPSNRLFLVGDAAEYVEPFTGEGMAWALAGGASVVKYAMQALTGQAHGAATAWSQRCRAMLGWRHRRCTWTTRALRFPGMVSLGMRLLNACPQIARPYLNKLNGPALVCD